MLSLSFQNPNKTIKPFEVYVPEKVDYHYTKTQKNNIINNKNPQKTPSDNASNDSHSTKANSFFEEGDSPTLKTSLNTPIASLPKFKSLDPSLLNSVYKQIIKEESINSKLHPKLVINFSKQNINEIHRAILIDWLVNVHLYMGLSDECLFLTVKIVDTFISKVQCFHKSKLQLLGIVALLLSSKFIESFHPYMDDLCALCENAYTEKEILQFEKHVLQTLDYTLEQDSIVNFYDMLSLIFKFNLNEYYLGKYLLELSLLDTSFYKYGRTLIAFSVVYLVMKMNLERHPNYKKCFCYLKDRDSTEPQMKLCGKQILNLMEKTKEVNQYTSSLQKYKHKIKENTSVEEDVEMIL